MKVIIVGGGFAGVNLAKALAGKKEIEVTLVDKNNYHFFPPLLYQVATSFIEASNISYPFRRMFQHKKNIRFHHGAVISVNSDENKIETDSGILDYDYLVLAMGAETNYFVLENVKKHSLPMKTIDDALNMKSHLLLHMERATRTDDEQEKTKTDDHCNSRRRTGGCRSSGHNGRNELNGNKGWIKVIAGEYENLISKIPNYSKQFLYYIRLESGKQFSITTENGLLAATVADTVQSRQAK